MRKNYHCPLESQEQRTVMDWAMTQPILRDYLIHIPNGGYRKALEARNLKRQGVRKGVSDFFLPWPTYSNMRLPIYGLWIEMKRRDEKISRLTIDQKKWISKMNELGYLATVAYGADQAMEIFKSYLFGALNEKM